MAKKKMLVCGAAGFIGRNVLEHYLRRGGYELYATYHRRRPPAELSRDSRVRFIRADLTRAGDVKKVLRGIDVVVQAAATTSGSRDIVSQPFLHVTDNAVMNSLIFRACHENKVGHVVFFSCTVMYPELARPVRETDFSGAITEKYFGVGWTKVYIEKMCEFYSRIGPTRYTAIRHSNIYGPHDKYDLEKSHVLGATVAKVMTARDGKVVVWGEGSEARDLLYVDDLVRFVDLVVRKQSIPLEVINVGSGQPVSVLDLVGKVITLSGKELRIEFDRSKPTIPFKLSVNASRAKRVYGWSARTSLNEGIRRSLRWYVDNCRPKRTHLPIDTRAS